MSAAAVVAVSLMGSERKPNRRSAQARNAQAIQNIQSHARNKELRERVITWLHEQREADKTARRYRNLTDLAAAHFGVAESLIDSWITDDSYAHRRGYRAQRTAALNLLSLGASVLQHGLEGR